MSEKLSGGTNNLKQTHQNFAHYIFLQEMIHLLPTKEPHPFLVEGFESYKLYID